MMTFKCPKCSNLVNFEDGRLFGFCNKCGSNLERTVGNAVSVYDREQEQDELVCMSWDRCDACVSKSIPDRHEVGFDVFDAFVEMLMDTLMSFVETQKDVISEVANAPVERRLRVYELCYDMTQRVYKQFETFLSDYKDYGMYDEFKNLNAHYISEIQKMGSTIALEQKKQFDDYWTAHSEEYEKLKKDLEEAKARKTKLFMYDLKANWEADNEIHVIEEKLYGKRGA